MGAFSREDFKAEDLKNVQATGLDLDDPEVLPPDPSKVVEGTPDPNKPTYVYGDDAPEELRGKTPEDALKMIDSLTRAGRVLAQMTQNQGMPQQQRPATPPPPAPAPVRLEASDLLEEDKLNQKLDLMFQQKVQPLAEENLRTAASNQYQGALSRYPRYQKYASEVQAFVNGITLAQAADPNTWDYLDAALARKYAAQEAQEQVRKTPPPPDTSRGRGIPENEGPGNNVLSNDEKMVAQRLGIPEHLYARQKQLMGEGF